MRIWLSILVCGYAVAEGVFPGLANAEERYTLISEEEAAMEPSPLRGRKDLYEGPAILIESPDVKSDVHAPVLIHVIFSRGANGLAPNPKTLKVTYLKAWGINITSRVQKFFKDDTIYLPNADIPKGRHSIEVYIEDEEANPSSRTVTFTVAKNKSD